MGLRQADDDGNDGCGSGCPAVWVEVVVAEGRDVGVRTVGCEIRVSAPPWIKEIERGGRGCRA